MLKCFSRKRVFFHSLMVFKVFFQLPVFGGEEEEQPFPASASLPASELTPPRGIFYKTALCCTQQIGRPSPSEDPWPCPSKASTRKTCRRGPAARPSLSSGPSRGWTRVRCKMGGPFLDFGGSIPPPHPPASGTARGKNPGPPNLVLVFFRRFAPVFSANLGAKSSSGQRLSANSDSITMCEKGPYSLIDPNAITFCVTGGEFGTA